MDVEGMTYLFFGNNLVIGKHIRRQLDFLQDILPSELRNRQMDDLGCGDGKVTVLLKEILQPSKLRGFDVSQNLVHRAIRRGIDAGNIDLNSYVPHGELAVVWGVLHHLKNPRHCVAQLKNNYPLIFIREPIKTKAFNGMELGHPMRMRELSDMINEILPESTIHYCGNNMLAFYIDREYIEKEHTTKLNQAYLSNVAYKDPAR